MCSTTTQFTDTSSKLRSIKVVGIGGAGGKVLQHLINLQVLGAELIAVDTDASPLRNFKVHTVIEIGSIRLDVNAKPDNSIQIDEAARSRIEIALHDALAVFIVAGMGGGVGTGAAPVIAKIAKDQGALTIAVVSKPFSFEGRKCMKFAADGVAILSQHVDSLIVFLNANLEEIDNSGNLLEWLQQADDVLCNTVVAMLRIMAATSCIHVDFDDVKTIMGTSDRAMVGTGTASGVNRARIAAENAVVTLLQNGAVLSGALGILFNITASRGLLGRDIKDVGTAIHALAAPTASVAMSIAIDETTGDYLRVGVIVTGLPLA